MRQPWYELREAGDLPKRVTACLLRDSTPGERWFAPSAL
jgi:hypothetical protein